MRKSNKDVWILIGASVVIAGALISIWPYFHRPGYTFESISCQRNLKNLGESTILYESDFDDRIPTSIWATELTNYYSAASAHGYAGSTLMKPILMDSERLPSNFSPFRCPSISDSGYGYALNAHIVGKVMRKEGQVLPLYFDSQDMSYNAVETVGIIALRHSDKATVVYTDSSVKTLRGSDVLEKWK